MVRRLFSWSTHRTLLRSTSSLPASVCWALIRRSHPRRPASAGLASSTSPSMARLTPGLSSSTSPSMASVRWTYSRRLPRRRPASAGLILVDFHVDGQRAAGLILVDFHVDGQRAAGLPFVDSSSTAGVPLDFLASTPHRRPACCWTSSRRLLVDGQRAAGLSLRDSLTLARRLLCADRHLPCADSLK